MLALLWTTSQGSVDDLGRAGRRIAFVCRQQDVCTTGGHGPWPGSFYSVPITVALLVVIALAAASLVVTARRPRDGSDAQIVRLDNVIRRRSAETVVASVGIAVGATLAGVCATVAAGLLGSDRAPLALQVAAWVAVVLGAVAVGLVTWCLVVLALPGAGAVAQEQTSAARPASPTPPTPPAPLAQPTAGS